MNYKIDIKRITDGNMHIQGWALPFNIEENLKFQIIDENNNEISIKLTKLKREDVASIYLNDTSYCDFGFDIEFPYDESLNKTYKLIISDSKSKIVEKLNKNIVYRFNTTDSRKKELILSYLNINTFKRAFKFLFKEGIIAFFKKTKRKINGITVDYDYSEWYELTKVSSEELEKQRNYNGFEINPFYSIVIPVFDTSDEFLRLLFESIFEQTYNNFELCIVDATNYNSNKNNPKKFFDKYFKSNEFKKFNFDYNKINIKFLTENKSIADNTNEAIKMAKGDYIVLCDHDDSITPDALFTITSYINNNKNALILYSDEDKVDTKNESFFEPAFKSDFNLDMLLSVNYFCHLTTIKKSLLDELYEIDGEYERNEYNGAQDYDLFLRLVNLIINKTYNDGNYDTSSICHIKKVLYHWRCHKLSTSKNTSSKTYAFTNGEKAVENFILNSKINFPKFKSVEKGFDFGLYHTIYDKDINEPLISVIIPNKDHRDDLKLAIESVLNGDYKNIEFVICENNSKNKETFEYYDYLKNTISAKIVNYEGTFNYSKINNLGVKHASGEYLLFLNNDVEMINKNSLHEMLSYLKRDDVGAVGAKLLYRDNTYQHAGVIIGIGGIADHAFRGINDFDHTYMNRAQIVQDLNAVTAACLMTKKSIYNKVNGFDENLVIAFNDIDYCLRVRKESKLIVYNPYSSFYHYESKSRGLEDTPEKVKRFNNEFAFFVKRWKDVLDNLDCYYNPNLTLRQNNFALRNLKYEKINEPYKIPNEIQELISKL